MRLLMVTHHVPRPTWGAGTRNYHLLRALARAHTVSLLSLVDTSDPESRDTRHLDHLVSTLRLEPLPPAQHKRLLQVKAAATGQSYLLAAHTLPQAQIALDDELARARYDAVLFESVIVASYRLPRGVRTIIDQHNIEYELLWRTVQQEPSLLRRGYNWLEYRRLKPRELARCGAADLVLVTSEREQSLLAHELPHTAVRVVRNGVDIAAFDAAPTLPAVAGRIVFTGTFTYYPNTQAVLHFARRCWPRVRAQEAGATWYIVGHNPPPEIRALGALPGVTVAGSVPEVQPYLAQAQVAVVPVLTGAGTRLKILDAFAMRKAVVSTSLGCEGLDVAAGDQLVVADEPDAFADAVVALLRDPERRSALGAAGRALVEAAYGWEASGEQLLGALNVLDALPAVAH